MNYARVRNDIVTISLTSFGWGLAFRQFDWSLWDVVNISLMGSFTILYTRDINYLFKKEADVNKDICHPSTKADRKDDASAIIEDGTDLSPKRRYIELIWQIDMQMRDARRAHHCGIVYIAARQQEGCTGWIGMAIGINGGSILWAIPPHTNLLGELQAGVPFSTRREAQKACEVHAQELPSNSR